MAKANAGIEWNGEHWSRNEAIRLGQVGAWNTTPACPSR